MTGSGTAGNATRLRPLAVFALVLAVAGFATGTWTTQPSFVFAFSFTAVALLAAFVPSRRVTWLVGSALFVAALVWVYLLELIEPWQAFAVLGPAILSLYACVRYVQGAEHAEAPEQGGAGPWSRALLLSVTTLLIAGLALGAVTLGQRATRTARHARTNDELGAAAQVVSARLAAAGAPTGGVPDGWPALLADAARLSGRSLYLFAPEGTGHALFVGARWDSDKDPTVAIVRSDDEVPPDERQALRDYLQNRFKYNDNRRVWTLPVGGIPFGMPLFTKRMPAATPASSSLDKGAPSGFHGQWVLVLSPPRETEWWSAETRMEYARQTIGFVVWALVLGIGLLAVILRLSDERAGLLSKLGAAEARETIRRDAHDRIYNRLAAVAHGLEQPGADERVARGAAFEIRSTVDYLQTILRGDAPEHAAIEMVPLATQLHEIARSATRIWNIEVCLDMEGEVLLPPDLAWDVQCLVDEALSNAGEHSGASRAVVHVERVEERALDLVRFTVTDDGRWQAPDASRHSTGLAGMRARVRLLGGQFELTTGEDGSVVTVELPVEANTTRK